jgi:hypothetical protein
LPDAPQPPGGSVLDARLHLLDRQLLDGDGNPIGIVDDLDVEGVEAGADIAASAPPARVTGIFTGSVMATRLLGGKAPRVLLQTLPWRLVAKVGATVQLSEHEVTLDAL